MGSSDSVGVGVWKNHASQWSHVGSPLRPCATDIAFHNAILASHFTPDAPPRALILGVTPELAGLDWPTGSSVLAVDCSAAMIERVWPGYPAAGEGALLAH